MNKLKILIAVVILILMSSCKTYKSVNDATINNVRNCN